jgi:hypothetical protein
MATSRGITIKAKNVVIIGDGPMAFVTAIVLKERGVNVTLVGPRIDDFTRSGDYDEEVFDAISELIAPIKIIPSSGRHIKDIERQLLDNAKKLGVNIVKKTFIDFASNQRVVVADVAGTKQEIATDIIFDCTGVKRAVIKRLNAVKRQNVFSIFRADIHEPQTFAYVRIVTNITLKLGDEFTQNAQDPDSVSYALAMIELRKLGWDKQRLPIFNYALLPSASSAKPNKANLYIEIPANLNKNQVLKFTEIMLIMARRNPQDKSPPDLNLHSPSKKHSNKDAISIFTVDPQYTTPGYYLGDGDVPPIFPFGDATLDLPFILGQGLLRGLQRFALGMKSFAINLDETITINLDSYDASVKEGLIIQESVMATLNKAVAELFQKWKTPQLVIDAFEQARGDCTNVADREKINNELRHLKWKYCDDLFNEASEIFYNIKDEQDGFKKEIPALNEFLNRIIENLAIIYNYRDFINKDEFAMLTLVLQDMAERLSGLGDYYLNHKPPEYALAKKYFQLGLKLYNRYFPNENSDEKLFLYLSLIEIAYKKQNYKNIRSMYEFIETTLLPKIIKNEEKNQALDQIYFRTVIAYFDVMEMNIKAFKSSPESYTKKAPELIARLEEITNKISPGGVEYTRKLMSKIEEYKEKLNPLATSKTITPK